MHTTYFISTLTSETCSPGGVLGSFLIHILKSVNLDPHIVVLDFFPHMETSGLNIYTDERSGIACWVWFVLGHHGLQADAKQTNHHRVTGESNVVGGVCQETRFKSPQTDLATFQDCFHDTPTRDPKLPIPQTAHDPTVG